MLIFISIIRPIIETVQLPAKMRVESRSSPIVPPIQQSHNYDGSQIESQSGTDQGSSSGGGTGTMGPTTGIYPIMNKEYVSLPRTMAPYVVYMPSNAEESDDIFESDLYQEYDDDKSDPSSPSYGRVTAPQANFTINTAEDINISIGKTKAPTIKYLPFIPPVITPKPNYVPHVARGVPLRNKPVKIRVRRSDLQPNRFINARTIDLPIDIPTYTRPSGLISTFTEPNTTLYLRLPTPTPEPFISISDESRAPTIFYMVKNQPDKQSNVPLMMKPRNSDAGAGSSDRPETRIEDPGGSGGAGGSTMGPLTGLYPVMNHELDVDYEDEPSESEEPMLPRIKAPKADFKINDRSPVKIRVRRSDLQPNRFTNAETVSTSGMSALVSQYGLLGTFKKPNLTFILNPTITTTPKIDPSIGAPAQSLGPTTVYFVKNQPDQQSNVPLMMKPPNSDAGAGGTDIPEGSGGAGGSTLGPLTGLYPVMNDDHELDVDGSDETSHSEEPMLTRIKAPKADFKINDRSSSSVQKVGVSRKDPKGVTTHPSGTIIRGPLANFTVNDVNVPIGKTKPPTIKYLPIIRPIVTPKPVPINALSDRVSESKYAAQVVVQNITANSTDPAGPIVRGPTSNFSFVNDKVIYLPARQDAIGPSASYLVKNDVNDSIGKTKAPTIKYLPIIRPIVTPKPVPINALSDRVSESKYAAEVVVQNITANATDPAGPIVRGPTSNFSYVNEQVVYLPARQDAIGPSASYLVKNDFNVSLGKTKAPTIKYLPIIPPVGTPKPVPLNGMSDSPSSRRRSSKAAVENEKEVPLGVSGMGAIAAPTTDYRFMNSGRSESPTAYQPKRKQNSAVRSTVISSSGPPFSRSSSSTVAPRSRLRLVNDPVTEIHAGTVVQERQISYTQVGGPTARVYRVNADDGPKHLRRKLRTRKDTERAHIISDPTLPTRELNNVASDTQIYSSTLHRTQAPSTLALKAPLKISNE